jgi:peroxiredoxin
MVPAARPRNPTTAPHNLMTTESPPSPARQRLAGLAVLAAAVAIALAVVGYFLLSGDGGGTGTLKGGSIGSASGLTPIPNTGVLDPQRPDVGKPAPDFALIDVRDGTTIRKLSDFRGKPVVVNWYASWCGPCKEEIPDFQRLYETNRDALTVLGVDALESRGKALGILDELKATYPAVVDTTGVVTDHYRVTGLPVTFFIDKDGIIRAIKTGQIHRDELEQNLAKIGITYKAQ